MVIEPYLGVENLLLLKLSSHSFLATISIINTSPSLNLKLADLISRSLIL